MGETYTSLWQQYGETIKPVVRSVFAVMLGLWTAVDGSWLAVGIAHSQTSSAGMASKKARSH